MTDKERIERLEKIVLLLKDVIIDLSHNVQMGEYAYFDTYKLDKELDKLSRGSDEEE